MAAKPAENWMAVAAPVCVAAAGEVEPPTASASVELADLDSVVVMVDADVASVVVLPEPVGYGAVELATTGAVVTTETLVVTAGADVTATTGTGTLEAEAEETGAASVEDEISTLEYAGGASTADVVSTALVSTTADVVGDGRSYEPVGA